MSTPTICQVFQLGLLPYADAWALQKRLAAQRAADEIPDTLLLLEHPHIYTLGSSGHDENILLSSAELRERRIDVQRVDRGGDVTYHGQGQLVGYPIFKLPSQVGSLHADVISYVRAIEQTIIDALQHFDIEGWQYSGLTGVWTGEKDAPAKICAIGVKVTTKRVTQHGFALNVNTDLSYFEGIIPCGIRDKAVTSMQELLDASLNMTAVSQVVIESFASHFDRRVVMADPTSVA
ncbi:MAG: lipoyl(octanoyl) transferase LipB [Anaerolineae bacterium]|nr:lipoyl(octanoyl) transferase LipB [Anaerolineae bacterium]